MRRMHADWMRKRRVAKVRREVDRQTVETIKRVVGDRVGRLEIAANNLDQQRYLIERRRFRADFSK